MVKGVMVVKGVKVVKGVEVVRDLSGSIISLVKVYKDLLRS